MLLSATMPADVLAVSQRFMRNPLRILVREEEITLAGILQFYVMVEKEVSVYFKDMVLLSLCGIPNEPERVSRVGGIECHTCRDRRRSWYYPKIFLFVNLLNI